MPEVIRIPLLILFCAAIVILWYRRQHPSGQQASLISRLSYSRTAFSRSEERKRNAGIASQFPAELEDLNLGRPVTEYATSPELLSSEALAELRLRELRTSCEWCGIDHTGDCEEDPAVIEPTRVIPALPEKAPELLPAAAAEVSSPDGPGFEYDQAIVAAYAEAEREHFAALVAAIQAGQPFGTIVPPYVL